MAGGVDDEVEEEFDDTLSNAEVTAFKALK